MTFCMVQRILMVTTLWIVGLACAHGQPNILVIWGEKVGQSNISAYSFGLVGYRTPNIDRIAREGMLFTDYYGEQSSAASRSSYITGQSVYRTGHGMAEPAGAAAGMRKSDPTIAALLKEYGYLTGHFGVSHLGARDEHLPTNHGFDEFFGSLYDSDAAPAVVSTDGLANAKDGERAGLRGVIRSFADGRIADTGPLTKDRIKGLDGETLAAAISFMDRAHAEGKPFYVWWNATRLRSENQAQPGSGPDGHTHPMVQHDAHVGELLARLDELGIAANTIVQYTTDHGPDARFGSDSGASPFAGTGDNSGEGARRVPSMVRWPASINAGAISNEIMHHMDWLPTFLAIVGAPDIGDRLSYRGVRAIGRRYKAYLDGYNFLPWLQGQEDSGPRHEILYFADTGELTAVRYDGWKAYFMERQKFATLRPWFETWAPLQFPMLSDLRRDPFEHSRVPSTAYNPSLADEASVLAPARIYLTGFVETFKEFPPRQAAPSYGIEQVLSSLATTENQRQSVAAISSHPRER